MTFFNFISTTQKLFLFPRQATPPPVGNNFFQAIWVEYIWYFWGEVDTWSSFCLCAETHTSCWATDVSHAASRGGWAHSVVFEQMVAVNQTSQQNNPPPARRKWATWKGPACVRQDGDDIASVQLSHPALAYEAVQHVLLAADEFEPDGLGRGQILLKPFLALGSQLHPCQTHHQRRNAYTYRKIETGTCGKCCIWSFKLSRWSFNKYKLLWCFGALLCWWEQVPHYHWWSAANNKHCL